MTATIGFILGSLTIRNFCFLYFLLAPFFLNQGLRMPLGPIFGAGYIFSLPIVLLYLAGCLTGFRHRVAFGKLTALVVALIGVCLLSVIVNTPSKLFLFERHFFWYLKFLIPAACFLIMVRVWKREDFSMLYSLLFSLVCFSLVLCVTQMVVDIPPMADTGRVSSFFRDSNGYGLLLNMLLCFTFPLFIWRMRRSMPLSGYLFLNGVLLVTVGLTGSRGGFLIAAAIVGVSVMMTRAWRLIFGLGALVMPFLILFVYIFKSRYDGGHAAMSDMGRLWTTLVALEIIQAKPLIGLGFGNVLDAYSEFGTIYAMVLGRPLEIHNAFLEIFAESGVLAFVFYAMLLGAPLVVLGRRMSRDSLRFFPLADLVAFNIVLSFAIYSLFYPEFLGHDDFWVYYSLAIVLMRARIQDPDFHFRLYTGNGGGKDPSLPGDGGREGPHSP